jgi:phosphosulfolactate synthase (CoM biosynthesis protein A)
VEVVSNTRSLPGVRLNDRPEKPRQSGITEVRGQYYTITGPRYLADLFEVAGEWIDWFKVPGPGIALTPRDTLKKIASLCEDHNVKMGAGGLIEAIVPQGRSAVESYFAELPDLGFKVVEISAGMIALSDGDFLRLVERAKKTGLIVKAEVGIQFGAGGTTDAAVLEAEGVGSVSRAISLAKSSLTAGADMIVLESEGVTESVRAWRTDVPAALADAIGMDRLLFEAADPRVFEWYVKNFGPEVNLFVDHSQALLLEAVRSGIWGSSSIWSRVHTYKG